MQLWIDCSVHWVVIQTTQSVTARQFLHPTLLEEHFTETAQWQKKHLRLCRIATQTLRKSADRHLLGTRRKKQSWRRAPLWLTTSSQLLRAALVQANPLTRLVFASRLSTPLKWKRCRNATRARTTQTRWLVRKLARKLLGLARLLRQTQLKGSTVVRSEQNAEEQKTKKRLNGNWRL